MCFQYTTKLRRNVVYVFSIFNGDVITPNLSNYRTDMTISSTALNQSKPLEFIFTSIIIVHPLYPIQRNFMILLRNILVAEVFLGQYLHG